MSEQELIEQIIGYYLDKGCYELSLLRDVVGHFTNLPDGMTDANDDDLEVHELLRDSYVDEVMTAVCTLLNRGWLEASNECDPRFGRWIKMTDSFVADKDLWAGCFTHGCAQGTGIRGCTKVPELVK